MGKPKRVIVWEGDTSNLPNRNEKKNIVYPSPKLGSMIECFEDTVNPSLPYRITFNPREIKFIQVTRTSTLKQLKGSNIYFSALINTRFNSNIAKYPNWGIWAANSGTIVTPGIWLCYTNSNVKVEIEVIPCVESIELDQVETPAISIRKLSSKLIFETLTYSRMQWNADNSGCVTHFGSCMQIPIIFYRNPDGRISWTKCSVENIRNFIESKKEALVVFCYPSQYDGDIITGFNTKFVQKTYEQLGIQDLYEEYLEQSK